MRNLHFWRERASGWVVSCLSQFQVWKISIQVGVWRGHSGISWIFNGFFICKCNIYGISWFILVQHFPLTISSLYCIFLLMEGLCFGWTIVVFRWASHGPFFIVIILIHYFLLHKVSCSNAKLLYVKVIINEQTMTIFPLYWCTPL